MSDTPRDCEHGQLARACRICELERELAAEREKADRAKADGIKEGLRRAAEICRARAVKLAPEHTAHTEDGCYDCGAEDEADYLALAILKEAGE